VSSYSLTDAARICRVPASRLRAWERMALLRAEDALRAPVRFEFRDLVSVRRLRALLERGVPLRQIRRGVQAVRAHLPGIDRPLEAIDVWLPGSRHVVLRAEGLLAEPDGQLVLDLARPSPRRVMAIEPRPPAGGEAAREPGERSVEAWFEIGCGLDADRETWGEAAEAYQRALALDPSHADSHCNLGSIYYNQGRRAQAGACFERALEADPRHVEANLNLATVLEEEERFETALRHYKRALETDPRFADAHVSLALLYERLGLRRTARGHWRRYLQLEPAGTWADVARRHLGA
jgi:tetratricopeptide (TPR) repeat protein